MCFMPILSMALSNVLPIKNSSDKSAIINHHHHHHNERKRERGNTINPLGILYRINLMGLIPSNKQSISHCKRRRMIRCKIVKIIHTPGQGSVDMSNDLPLKVLLTLKFMEIEGFPETTGFGGDGRRDDFDFFFAVAGRRARVVGANGERPRMGDCVDAHRDTRSGVDWNGRL